jgi:PAS domain S-box-containing protein
MDFKLTTVGAQPMIKAQRGLLGDISGLSREAIEALPVAVYMTDAEGRLTFYNEAAAALWGQRPQLGDCKFCGSWKLYWPDGTLLPHDQCPMAMALLQERPIRGMEAVAERPDGTRVPFTAYPTPLFDESGRLTGAVNMLVDIRERKRVEANLAERQAQLSVFVEHAPAAIAMFDRDMRYLAVSRRYILDFRLPPDADLIGRSHYEIFPDIPQRWRDVHARVLAGEELSQEEDQFARQDGSTQWLNWSMAPWCRADGSIGGALLFSEHRTEQVEARHALADSEGRFRATFENAAVGVAMVAPDGSILRANNSFARMLGYSIEELMVRTFQDITHPDDLASNLSIRNKTLNGETDGYCIEKRYVRKDGGIIWALLTVGCVRKADGSVDYFVSVIQDISDRKQVEQQQRVLMAELDHRVKNALATVSAVVSHTRQGSRSIADFVAALDGRIRSLAGTHELLSSRRWDGVSLSELVRRVLAPYATGSNSEIGGPEVTLSAEAGQVVSMVLYELTTNAAKHGALSVEDGQVSVHWYGASKQDLDARIAIEWQETGGPAVQVPEASGYGTEVIRDLIPYELGGRVDLTFAADGLRCHLEIPAEWLSTSTRLF